MAIKGTLYAISKTQSDIDTQSIFKAMVKESEDSGAVVIDGRNIAAGSIYANQIHADAITAKHIKSDAITADHIGAGVIDASKIITGTLQSQNSNSWLNLNDGSFSFGNGSILYENNRLNITANSISIGATSVATKKELEDIELTPGPKGSKGDPGSAGQDAYTVILTNESHIFPGNETHALGNSITLNVLAYRGATQVASSIASVSGQVDGLTASIAGNNTTNNRLTVSVTTEMVTQSGMLTLPITVDGKSFTRTFSFSLALKGVAGSPGQPGAPGDKGEPGAPGANAQLIHLTASSQIFKNPKTGSVTPTTITVTGTAQNTTITTWQYSTNGGSFTTTTPTGVSRSGNTVTLDGTQMTARTIAVKALNGSIEDTVTIAKVEDGIDGTDGEPGVGITSVDVEYYLSTSSSVLSGGRWSTVAPPWENGLFMWSRTKTYYTVGNPTESDPVCITGEKGQEGTAGRGVSSITEEYAISKSKEVAPTGDDWKTEAPEWSTGQYMWTRSKIVYTNPSGTDYTTPIVDTAWEAIDESIQGIGFRDKDTLSGTEIFTGKADDSVVHVEIDGKSYQHSGSGKNLFPHAEVIDGSYHSSAGTLTSNSTSSTSLGFIVIQQGKTYVWNKNTERNIILMTYDANKKPLERILTYSSPTAMSSTVFNDNVAFVQVSSYASSNYDFSDFQFEEGSTATEYELPAPTPDYPIKIHSLNNFDVVSSVGKRNLIRNGQDVARIFTNGYQGASFSIEKVDMTNEWGFSESYRIRTSGGDNFIKAVWSSGDSMTMEFGKEYTVSFYVKNNHSEPMEISTNGLTGAPTINIPERFSGLVTGTGVRRVGHSWFQLLPRTIGDVNKDLDITIGRVKVEESREATPWNPDIREITESDNHPLINKINLLLSEPLRSVRDVKDRLIRDSDGLWKIERNTGEYRADGSENWRASQYGANRWDTSNSPLSVSAVNSAPYNAKSSHFINDGASGNKPNQTWLLDRNIRVIYGDSSTTATQVKSYMKQQHDNGTPVTWIYDVQTPTIEILDQELQDKLNNLRSFQDSNYVYTIVDKSSISESIAENLKPTLHATFKGGGWYRNFTYTNQLGQAKESLTSLENITLPALEDGLFNKAEKEAVRQSLNVVTADKSGIDAQYTAVYGNSSLIGTPKTNLYNAKVAYNTAYGTLEVAINTVLNVADGTRVTTAQYNNVQTRFTNYQNSLSTLKRRFEEALDAISGKKVKDVDDELAKVATRVTNAEQKITDDAIVSTVTSSTTFSNVASLAESAKSTLDSKSKVWDGKASPTDISKAIDEIEVGGRNLMRDSKELFHALGKNSHVIIPEGLPVGVYAISFDYIVDNIGGRPSSFLLYTDRTLTHVPLKEEGADRTKHTFNVTTVNENKAIFIYFGSGAAESRANEGTWYNIKLEKGNKATDWTPAPEDVEDSINNVASDLSSVESRVRTAEQKITDENIVSTVTSSTTFKTVSGNASSAKSTLDSKAGTWDGKASTGYVDGKASTAEANAKTHAENLDAVQALDGNSKKFINPASLRLNSSSLTGYLIIRTPITHRYMTRLKISGYNYQNRNTDISLDVGFYAYTNNSILQTSYVSHGNFSVNKVQIARDSSGRAVVIIGESNTRYSYPNIVVDEAIIGHDTPPDSYKDGWSMSVSTSLSGLSNIVNVAGSDTQKAIGDVVSRVSTAEQKITDSAIVSTVRESTTYKNDLSGKVSTNEIISRINQTSESVTIDAKKINLNGQLTIGHFGTGLKNDFDSKATTSQAQSYASTAESNAKNHAGDLVDGIEIGGRNLFRGNSNFVSRATSGGHENHEGVTLATSWIQFAERMAVESNEPIVISMWAKTTGSSSGTLRIHPVQYTTRTGSTRSTSPSQTFSIGSDWRKVEYKLTTHTTSQSMDLYLRVDSSGATVSKIMVERGTKASDWSPAPEDVESHANSVAEIAEINAKEYAGKLFRAYGIGYSNRSDSDIPFSSGRIIDENGRSITSGNDRSYLLAVIDRNDKVVYQNTFDIYSNASEATTLANRLNGYDKDYLIILVGSHAPGSNRTGGGLPSAIYRCGGSPEVFIDEDWASHPAYILIGRPGIGEGNGFEAFSPKSSGAMLDITFPVKNGTTSLIGSNNAIRRNASDAKSKTDKWSYSNTTEIDGGTIRTGTIEVGTIKGRLPGNKLTLDGNVTITSGLRVPIANITGLTANNITTGTLKDANNRNNINLNNGTFSLANGNIVYDGNALSIKGGVSFGALDSTTRTNITNGAAAKTTLDSKAGVWDSKASSTDISNAINKIEVGGKNLLKNSGEKVSNGTYNIARYDLTDKIKEGEEVTLTIWGSLAATKSNFRAYNSGGSISLVALTDNGDGTYSRTFKWRIGSSTNTYLNIYAFTNAQTGTSTINKIKLEKGNKATDWTPAPEDVDAGINTAQSTANNAKSKTDAWSWSGGTEIDGGKIRTETIKSNQIAAGSITADKIVMGTGTPSSGNLAAGRTFSGSYSGVTPGNGNNTVGTSYATFGAGGSNNNRAESAYIQVDLGSAQQISESRIFWYASDRRRYYYKIKYSTNGSTWFYAIGNSANNGWTISIHPSSGSSGGYEPTIDRFAIPITARYLRIYGNGSTSNTSNHIYEWELYSKVQTTISGSEIVTGTLSADKITGRIPGGKITLDGDVTVNGTFKVSNGNINSGIEANKITTGTMHGNRITANTISANRINTTTLSAITANLGTVTAGIIEPQNNTTGKYSRLNLNSGIYESYGTHVVRSIAVTTSSSGSTNFVEDTYPSYLSINGGTVNLEADNNSSMNLGAGGLNLETSTSSLDGVINIGYEVAGYPRLTMSHSGGLLEGDVWISPSSGIQLKKNNITVEGGRLRVEKPSNDTRPAIQVDGDAELNGTARIYGSANIMQLRSSDSNGHGFMSWWGSGGDRRAYVGFGSQNNNIFTVNNESNGDTRIYGKRVMVGTTEIASSGSNTDGNWVRFYDGTQICWNGNFTKSSNLTNSVGGLYRSPSVVWNFPQSFPVGSVSVTASSNTWQHWCTLLNFKASSVAVIEWSAYSGRSGDRKRMLAIGRWR